jgi:hypothetical protein
MGGCRGLGQKADDFLGTQGDPWDTQRDMFMCLIISTAVISYKIYRLGEYTLYGGILALFDDKLGTVRCSRIRHRGPDDVDRAAFPERNERITNTGGLFS